MYKLNLKLLIIHKPDAHTYHVHRMLSVREGFCQWIGSVRLCIYFANLNITPFDYLTDQVIPS